MEDNTEDIKDNNKQPGINPVLTVFILLWGAVLFWRCFILYKHVVNYVDDDQALMWYGTVLFAHGSFPQPAFFGQSYGSMFESLLTVPLYLCGWPLHVAQPVVTTFMGIIAFLFASISCYRKNNKAAAFLCVLLLAMTGWQWDVVTSLRCYFTGLPVTTIGCILINDPKMSRLKIYIGSFLSIIGVIWSASAIAVLGIGFLWFVTDRERLKKSWGALIPGSICGLLIWLYRIIFFKNHGDYISFKMTSSINLQTFLRNIKLFPQRIAENFAISWAGLVIIPALIIFSCIICIKRKMWRRLAVIIISVSGSLAMLSSTQLNSFDEYAINYCQLRMLLFMTFIGLLLIVLFSYDGHPHAEIDLKKAVILFTIAMISIIIKGGLFIRACADPDSALYGQNSVNYMSIDELNRVGNTITGIADEYRATVLTSLDLNLIYTYGFAALYYDKPYEFYLPTCDRRAWVYYKLLNSDNETLMLYGHDENGDIIYSVEDTGGSSVIDYLDQNYGVRRVMALIETQNR